MNATLWRSADTWLLNEWRRKGEPHRLIRCECGARLYRRNLRRHRMYHCSARFDDPPPVSSPTRTPAIVDPGSIETARQNVLNHARIRAAISK